jgi:hypothetical protein
MLGQKMKVPPFNIDKLDMNRYFYEHKAFSEIYSKIRRGAIVQEELTEEYFFSYVMFLFRMSGFGNSERKYFSQVVA